ncbi:MAG TPA: hypothetical protein VE988_01160 [Gemmataceae bacterium]|nr:hypothetical protein [Gemmataceae bacterium]
MAMNKGCMIGGIVGCGVLVLGGFCVGGFIWFFGQSLGTVFSDMAAVGTATDEFLGLLGDGKIDEAYDSAAAGLRAQQSKDAFAAEVKRLGLTEYVSSTWSKRNFVNNNGDVEGTITTKSGKAISLKVGLVKEGGTWRVLSLTGPAAGVGSDKRPIPPDDELRKMATATLLDFNDAVKAKDFTAFHAKLSTPLRKQSPKDIEDKFKDFVINRVDISGVKDVEAVLEEPPSLDKDGMLVVTGYYPTAPMEVRFQLKYVYEHPAWKLNAINVKTGK